MSLPELPSDQKITKWAQNLLRLIRLYARTVWLVLSSPTSLVLHSMHDRSIRETKEQMAPLLFALLTLVFASLLETVVANLTFSVDKPFFEHPAFLAQIRVYNYWMGSLQKFLPVGFSASIFLSSIAFAFILLVVVFWARALARPTRRFWTDLAALLYLLPIPLIVKIVGCCAINLIFRMIGESALLIGSIFIIIMLKEFIVYSIVLRVVDQVYFKRRWQRIIHVIGYVMVVPVLLFVLLATTTMVIPGFNIYRIVSHRVEGDNKLHAGDYEAAGKLYNRAIQNDVTGYWSAGLRIRLISVDARRMLDHLPNLFYDSGMRERLHRRLEKTDPFRRVMKAWQAKGPISVTPEQLVEFRDSILDSYLSAGDIPITESELEHSLKSKAACEACDELPNEAFTGFAFTPIRRKRLYYLVYRSRVLKGEPTTADAMHYLLFLKELPIRIELSFVRYRALNLMRDSETLACLDDRSRLGILNRGHLIKTNREIRVKGAKYPHINMTDAQIEKLSDRELEFHFRQAYLNYLKAEVRLLLASRIGEESALIRQRAASIEERLNWVVNDIMYRDVPPANLIQQALLKLLGFDSKVMITNRGQESGVSP